VATVTLQAGKQAEVALLDGAKQTLLAGRHLANGSAGIVTRAFVAPQRRLEDLHQLPGDRNDMPSQVSREEALKSDFGARRWTWPSAPWLSDSDQESPQNVAGSCIGFKVRGEDAAKAIACPDRTKRFNRSTPQTST